jgi:glycosyltransferase involved in cell wall biosynthesis
MIITFLSDNMNFSGGRKLLFEYAEYLRSQNHQVHVLVQEKRGALSEMLDVSVVKDFSSGNIPECDIILATTPREVKQAYDSGKGRVVHFCQGFEVTDLEQRIDGTVIPPRFQGNGIISRISLARKRRSWKKKKAKIDKIYQLPTDLIAVSRHLQSDLEKRYERKVHLCINGINRTIFSPEETFKWNNFSESNPLKVINVGPYKVTFKGISKTYKAIKQLKEDNYPIEFIRVAPKFLEEEYGLGIVDKFYENIPPEELAGLFRSANVYISNSTEGEGFGLPAMEAMSCGLICILSSISSYKNFSDRDNHCIFVPEGDVDATVEAVKRVINLTKEQALDIRTNGLEVASGYTFEKSCKKFEEILQKVNQS